MSIRCAPLSEFAILTIEGDDSLTFLQGQLSQDMNAVRDDAALLASYCNPKGRVFATLLLWQDHALQSRYYALVSADNADFLQKRLRLFVLRAKVKISLTKRPLIGLWSTDRLALSQCVPTAMLNTLPSEKLRFTRLWHNNTYFIRYPDVDGAVRLLQVSFGENPPICAEMTQCDSRIWQQQDILTGIPWIQEKTREVFVAQSINQDAIGAVSFKKGCYTGQEVIARSHYLGTLKRRTFIAIMHQAIADTASLPASDVMSNDNPIGQVVNAVSVDEKTYLLIEIPLRYLEEGACITLAAFPDQTLAIQPVPYSVEKPA